MEDEKAPARLARRLLGRTVLSTAPSGLLARIRWLFLLYVLVSILVNAVQLGLTDTPKPSLRAAAAVGLAWLAWSWIHGFRHGYFSLVGDLTAAFILFVVGIALTNPARMLTLVYASVFFRSLYGSPKRVVGWTCLAFLAMVAAAARIAFLTRPPGYGHIGFAVIQLPTLAFVTGLLLLVARIVNQSERQTGREKVLSHAAATLVKAPGRDALHATALDAVMSLLEGVEGTQAAIWEGTSEDMQAVAAKGYLANQARGRTLRIRTLPEPLRSALREGRAIVAAGEEAATWADTLGVPLRDESGLPLPKGAVLIQPLVVRNDLRSVLTVVSDNSLRSDVRDALETISTQIGLVGELRQSERRFRSVVQNSSDVVTVVGPDATIRYVSPSVERVFGFKAAELRGVWLDDLAHPEDRAALLGYLYTASRQPEAADAVQWRWRDREGVWRDVETVGTNLVHMPDVAGVVLNTRDVSERKALERERAQLLDKTVQAAEEERTRLAAELHDGPIQRLTTMGYDLARAHRWLEKHELERGLAILETAQSQLSGEINGLRELMASLRPPVLDEVGLEAALREHVKTFSNRSGIACSLEASVARRLDPEIETVLYRVTQEALTNVAKHAHATHLWVTLHSENGAIELEVRDNGIGFATADSSTLTRDGHFGLVGMRQRVQMAGGRFDVASRPGGGVSVRATFGSPDMLETPPPVPGLTASRLQR
ncbi:MAG TPA: PAS domain-containing sensor histidine kinase [Actinomycetes bacterium]|nr:PAS domain-containing sensor histidine kinase [Actinomycetes bacterium]